MKAITGVFVILVAVLPGLGQESAPKAKTRDSTPNYYPLKVGTKWHYQINAGGQKVTMVYQIAKIESVNGKPLAVLEQSVNGEVQATEHVGVEAGGVFRYRFKDSEISPPVCLLKYPVKEGSSWETETKVGGQQITVSGRVGATEEVKLPDGQKYQAVSVTIETTVKGNKVSIRYWFAPDIGIIKESMGIPGAPFTMELLKFEEGK